MLWLLKMRCELAPWLRGKESERGQDLIEYSLILALLALFCAGIMSLTGQTISAMWLQVAGLLAAI